MTKTMQRPTETAQGRNISNVTVAEKRRNSVRPLQTTQLSEKSASRLTRKVNALNEKILEYVNK
ncbi:MULTISPECIES: hypothetical protein [unclassified Psychrobacillus]|uniref:hypothetical protein n=1 Tax=unclassified Psychrobacillus TaxID=2636677 RepID=UPI0030F4FF66